MSLRLNTVVKKENVFKVININGVKNNFCIQKLKKYASQQVPVYKNKILCNSYYRQ